MAACFELLKIDIQKYGASNDQQGKKSCLSKLKITSFAFNQI